MQREGADRVLMPAPPSGLHVVLVKPEIPPNTGNIGRLCVAAQSRLHLVAPLGFSLEDRYLKRAGLDYWEHVDLVVHPDWPAFLARERPAAVCLFSARAGTSYAEAPYQRIGELYLVFGCETSGLPPALLDTSHESYRIPIYSDKVRSLNLANAVSIVVYEALRRRGGAGGSG